VPRPGMERFAPLTGIVAVLLFVIAVIVGGETPDVDDSTREVVEFWRDEEGSQIAAAILGAWGSVLLVWFGGSLRERLRGAPVADPGSDRLAALAFAGFVVIAVGVLAFCGFAFAAVDAADEGLPPAVIQTLSVLNSDFFFIVAGGNFLAMLASGVAIVRYGRLPRWLGIVAILLGILALTPVGFLAFLATGVWVVIVSILLFTSPPEPVAAVPPAAPAAGAPPTV